jgi:integrase
MLAMRKPTITVKPYPHSLQHKFILDLRAFGRGRKFFKTRADAEAEALRQRILLERHSREAVGLSQREMSEIIHGRETLAKYGETLSDAVKFRVNHLDKVLRHGITASKLADEVIESKRQDGASKAYLHDLSLRLRRFCRDFGSRSIAGITIEELDNWLRNLEGSPKSRANYRANVAVMFSYATKRRMIDSNPVMFTARPKLIDKPPGIFTVDELRSLLEAAQRTEPSVLPMLAIGAFAGLRDAEIKRLDWSEIDLTRGHVEVTAAKAKSARRRLVPIQPNLAAWLRPYSGMKGHLATRGFKGGLIRVRKAAGLARWPNNGLRHSFASYRLAATNNAALVASELGHTSAQMLFAHYRELVHPEEAERYWQIQPAKEGAVIPFAAHS